jgi:apolipoprotein N-acyltransferase
MVPAGDETLKRLRPWLLVLLGGVLLPVSFCGFDQWYLTWVAFVPLLAAIDGVSRGRAALLGFVYGLVANQIGYYWIPYTINVFGGFPLPAALGFSLVLCGYQALQYLLLAYLIVRLRERGYSLLWVVPAAMVGLETVFPLLFPIFMGNTQHPVPLLIQSADLLGPLSITAVIMIFNVALYLAIGAALRKEPIPWKQVAAGPVALLLLLAYGALRISSIDASFERDGVPLRVGVIQPSMGIEMKWSEVEEGLRRHQVAALDLEERGAELIVWSEAAYTAGYVMPGERNLRRRLVPEIGTPMLVGALSRNFIERCRYQDGQVRCGRQQRTFNSAFILDAQGNVEGSYDKTFLLAFGEYIPFGEIFPQLYDYSPNSGQMTAGSDIDALPFPHQGRDWLVSVLICYEDILPAFTRDLVRQGEPNLLVNMTNDAWFGDSNEPWIHMDLAKFRAIEHRRYLIRATNTGVSAVIDPVGRLVDHTDIFQEQTLLSTVRLIEGGRTIYAVVGDVLGYLALALLAFGVWTTRKVWITAPKGEGRKGVTQAAGVLLAMGVLDTIFFTITLLARPAGWEMGALEILLWLVTIAALISAFIMLRRGHRYGLASALIGSGARLVLTGLLVAAFLPVGQQGVAVALAVPLVFVLASAATLWTWRERCAPAPVKAPATKGGKRGRGGKSSK